MIKIIEEEIKEEIKKKSYKDVHSTIMGILIKKFGFSKDKYSRGWDEYDDYIFSTGLWSEELKIYAVIQTGHFSKEYNQEYTELKLYDEYQSDLKLLDWVHKRGSIIIYEEIGEESQLIDLIDGVY
ncbi:hypothetical protein ACR77J_07855 [Tissierella praeacuta]|uniref:hypothetical protein n=1 Tax=Tissierella praeacuta TaxID=43131 RepID=UPI003DA4F1FC